MLEQNEERREFQSAAFILNPRSGIVGGKRGVIHQIDRTWGAAGKRYKILATSRPGEGERLARQEVEKGCELIVAVGGDGTLNEVVRGVLGSDACVGLIPSGSGNGFARHWDISLNMDTASRLLFTPLVVRCDIGVMDDKIFLVTFGCGLDAFISDRYASSTVRGMSSYFFHGVNAFFNYQSQEMVVRVNGVVQYSGRPLLLSLANTRGYGGGTIIAPQARTDDGWLDLCILEPLPLADSLIHFANLFNG
ncbi:MAG: diacylglycerol kinase family protein, partial [bacterium]